jgi:phosphohistidine phosphatase
MKTLTLLRHAKSAWDDLEQRDFDRPLNAKGKRAAAAVGRHLRGEGWRFDRLVASPAVRVRETLDAFGSGYGQLPEPGWDRRLYLAEPDTLLDAIRALPDDAESALLVAHNPGLEDLVLLLVPEGGLRDAVEEKYPTATAARMTLPIERWADAAPGTATLAAFVRPRDLDPTLGPDAN